MRWTVPSSKVGCDDCDTREEAAGGCPGTGLGPACVSARTGHRGRDQQRERNEAYRPAQRIPPAGIIVCTAASRDARRSQRCQMYNGLIAPNRASVEPIRLVAGTCDRRKVWPADGERAEMATRVQALAPITARRGAKRGGVYRLFTVTGRPHSDARAADSRRRARSGSRAA